jgi:hypothetical protein
MSRRTKTAKIEDERPMKKRIPPKSSAPGRDRHLGKQAVRSIAERIVGTIDFDDVKGHVIKGIGRRRMAIDEIPSLLAMHEGFDVELTIYQDHDPDGLFRMAEALQGWEGAFTGDASESIYVERLRQELQRAFPTIEYIVWLHSETIQIARLVDGKRRSRFLLASPELGRWVMEQWEDGAWELVGDDLSFLECITAIMLLERDEPGGS